MFQHKTRLFLQIGLVIAGLTVLFGCTSMVGTDLQTNSTSTLTNELSAQIVPEAKTANFRHMTIQPACLGQKEVRGAVRRAGINKALKDVQVRQILQDLAAQGVRFDLKTIKIQAKVLRQGQNLWVLLPVSGSKVISYQSSPNRPTTASLMQGDNNQFSFSKGDAIHALMIDCQPSMKVSAKQIRKPTSELIASTGPDKPIECGPGECGDIDDVDRYGGLCVLITPEEISEISCKALSGN